MNEKNLASGGFDWLSALTHGGPVGISIMVLLVVLSLVTWAFIFERYGTLRKLNLKSAAFLKSFWDAKSLSELHLRSKDIEYSPMREIFRTGYNEMVRVIQAREKSKASLPAVIQMDTVQRSLIKARALEEANLAKNMGILAVSASAGPFIGLFGTVVGIIRAFHDIGASGSSSLAAVAPGISEALIATALGLAAAIPAVIFYNVLTTKARQQLLEMDAFNSDFMNILERHFNISRAENSVVEGVE